MLRKFRFSLVGLFLFTAAIAFVINWYIPHDMELSVENAKAYKIEDKAFGSKTVSFNYQRIFPFDAKINGPIVFRDPQNLNYIVPNPDGHQKLFHLVDDQLLQKLKHPKIDEIAKSLAGRSTTRVKSIILVDEKHDPSDNPFEMREIDLSRPIYLFITNTEKVYYLFPKSGIGMHPDVSHFGPTMLWEFTQGAPHPIHDQKISVDEDVKRIIAIEKNRGQ
jgi:hypothetical protein